MHWLSTFKKCSNNSQERTTFNTNCYVKQQFLERHYKCPIISESLVYNHKCNFNLLFCLMLCIFKVSLCFWSFKLWIFLYHFVFSQFKTMEKILFVQFQPFSQNHRHHSRYFRKKFEISQKIVKWEFYYLLKARMWFYFAL